MPTHGSEFATLHVSVEPAYSSLLTARPGVDTEFLDLGCQAEKDVDFPSTTIDTVMATHSLTGVDWLHARIPCSVELYQSISEPVRKRVLAFDSVFLLMDIWQAQGSTVERFADLVRDGFWLSHMFSGGPIRIGEAARQRFAALAPDIGKDSLLQHHRRMPAYVCVRMFKTVEALREGDFSRREYLLLWAFATLDNQFGFAADVLVGYERVFGQDAHSRAMWDETVRLFRHQGARSFSLRGIAARLLPESVKRHLRPLVLGR